MIKTNLKKTKIKVVNLVLKSELQNFIRLNYLAAQRKLKEE